MPNWTFGIVGLGRIGGGLAYQALKKGHQVVGLDLAGAAKELLDHGLTETRTIEELAAALEPPRIVFLYIHAGPGIDEELYKLLPHLQKGDIVLDGGNSYWKDSVARAQWMKEKGIHFLDLGTSGGVSGARNGACFMAGGDKDAFEKVRPTLEDLAVPGGVIYCGPSGTGHFVKLVHNGIEFGMLQAIGEGIDLLEKHSGNLPIEEIVGCWRNGSVIRSWLVDLMHEALQSKPDIKDIEGYVEDTGEVNWLVADALEMEVPIPVISVSVMQLFASRDDEKTWAKAVAMMRNGFGGHPYGPDEAIKRERTISRSGQQKIPPR